MDSAPFSQTSVWVSLSSTVGNGSAAGIVPVVRDFGRWPLALIFQPSLIVMAKKRILLVAEAATLAHVARPLALSAGLDPARFDLAFACARHCHWLLQGFGGEIHGLESIDSARFIAALARGKPLYDEATLHRYVQEDLRLLDEFRPDAVIGDFRLSLSVSARLAGIPYLAISNAYWSPYWRPPHYPVPNLWLTRLLPLSLAGMLFRMARPLAFALHCRPLNRVRRHYGLPSLGSDLRRIYTDADRVVYADVSEFFTGCRLPAAQHFIGPVLWSPPGALPAWWNTVPADRPLIYVTLGSSGQARLLPRVLAVLGGFKVGVMASTAGNDLPGTLPPNALAAPYLPGAEAARRAALVICNGGSLTCQQALAAGVPVLGIADNLDQFLNMTTIEAAGAGAVMRADRFDAQAFEGMVRGMLSGENYRLAAQRMAQVFTGYDSRARFGEIVEELLADQG